METVETVCKECGSMFLRERKRGRPTSKCPECRAKVTVAQAAVAAEINPETLFSGDPKMLLGTPNNRPRGAEAQCPLQDCRRIFSSNWGCENHKRYGKNAPATCVDPTTIGMVAREKRGIPIWVLPSTRVFE